MKELQHTVDEIAARLAPSTRPPLPQGHCLLPQGSKLTNWFLASLSSRGVDTLPARGAADPAPACGENRGGARLDRLFRKFADTPADPVFA